VHILCHHTEQIVLNKIVFYLCSYDDQVKFVEQIMRASQSGHKKQIGSFLLTSFGYQSNCRKRQNTSSVKLLCKEDGFGEKNS